MLLVRHWVHWQDQLCLEFLGILQGLLQEIPVKKSKSHKLEKKENVTSHTNYFLNLYISTVVYAH